MKSIFLLLMLCTIASCGTFNSDANHKSGKDVTDFGEGGADN